MKRKRKTKCKNCKHFIGGGEINSGIGLCTNGDYLWEHFPSVHETDFCSRGERKGKEQNERK